MHLLRLPSSRAQLRATTTTTNTRVETLRPTHPAIVSPINHMPTTKPRANPTRTRLLTTTIPACRIPQHPVRRLHGHRMWLPRMPRTRRQPRVRHNGDPRTPPRKPEMPADTIPPSPPQAMLTALLTPRSHSRDCKVSTRALSHKPKPEGHRARTTNNYTTSSKDSNRDSRSRSSSSKATTSTLTT